MLQQLKIHIILFSALLLGVSSSAAQELEVKHWSADLLAGLNTDGYEVEIGCTWWPVNSFGVRVALGLASEIEEIGDWGWGYDDDDYGYYDEEYDYAARFKFMPSLVLRSPSLVKFSDGEGSLHLFANPGISLSPGASGSRNADWFNWQVRGGLEGNLDDVVLRLGYSYSNFNLYSGDPYCHHGLPDEIKRHTHSIFISFGINF